MEIHRIYTKTRTTEKEHEENDDETLISLRRENELLRKRVDELEKGLEEMIATANLIL